MAAAIEDVVRENAAFIKLIYIDVIEFDGKHIRNFYQTMATRFAAVYGEKLEAMKQRGELGDVDPMIGVIIASRWLFYFFTVETCFGVTDHLGMDSRRAVTEFIRLVRLGVLPRGTAVPASAEDAGATHGRAGQEKDRKPEGKARGPRRSS